MICVCYNIVTLVPTVLHIMISTVIKCVMFNHLYNVSKIWYYEFPPFHVSIPSIVHVTTTENRFYKEVKLNVSQQVEMVCGNIKGNGQIANGLQGDFMIYMDLSPEDILIKLDDIFISNDIYFFRFTSFLCRNPFKKRINLV